MNDRSEKIILIDLPTFPKGVISLSLLSVAASLQKEYRVTIDDLNYVSFKEYTPSETNIAMFGLKVSSQNFQLAAALTQKLKTLSLSAKIVWGGELPSLHPDLCLQYADSIFGGLFEPVAENFIADLKNNNLQKKYFGENNQNFIAQPDFTFLTATNNYLQFMGYPLETSRGCTENCIFCMVHTMQKKNYNTANTELLKNILPQYSGKFINVIDYNFGVNSQHVIKTAKLIQQSGSVGWMAEMCIELLDNDEVLNALRDSRCKMIYCGLESINQESLKSVHKMNTNHIENYERIIRKAQSYGVQIAAGIILGLEGTHENTFKELYKFYQRTGIIYAKLTFLTYNPGTKVHEYEKKKGVYLAKDISYYDGNHLSFLPNNVDANCVIKGTEWFIRKYYSLPKIITRSFNTQINFLGRLEFVLFNFCYREVYFQWLKKDILHKPENFSALLELRYEKPFHILVAEKLLHWVRRKNG